MPLTLAEVRELIGGTTSSDGQSNGQAIGTGDIKIVVLQRGWVAVGRLFQDGPYCRLENAMTIRRWGTSRGLGQIANGGPIIDKTVLDDAGTLRFHELTIVAAFDCDQTKWGG
jgi:hypothetical protein